MPDIIKIRLTMIAIVIVGCVAALFAIDYSVNQPKVEALCGTPVIGAALNGRPVTDYSTHCAVFENGPLPSSPPRSMEAIH